jgi:hypothetical protein
MKAIHVEKYVHVEDQHDRITFVTFEGSNGTRESIRIDEFFDEGEPRMDIDGSDPEMYHRWRVQNVDCDKPKYKLEVEERPAPIEPIPLPTPEELGIGDAMGTRAREFLDRTTRELGIPRSRLERP